MEYSTMYNKYTWQKKELKSKYPKGFFPPKITKITTFCWRQGLMYARLASNSLCSQERPRILGFLASTFQVLGLQMWETTDVCATSDGLNYSVWCSASEQARIWGKSLHSSGDTRNAVSYTHKKNLKEETGIEVKPQSLKCTQEARGSMRTIQLTNICALCHRHGTRHSCQTKRITSYFKMRSEKSASSSAFMVPENSAEKWPQSFSTSHK